MDFADAALVQLADPASRPNFFSAADVERLAMVAFDTGQMTLSGPYTAVFDELSLGFALPSLATIDGTYGPMSGADRNETRLMISGLSDRGMVRVDAIWRGRIVARSIPGLVPIQDVQFSWTDDAIDAEIIADLGALPAEPQLETERRARLLQRIKAGYNEPDAYDAARLDVWLQNMGVETVGELLATHKGTYSLGTAQITFPPPPAAAPAPRPLPFAAAILMRNADFSVGQLLQDSKTVREHLGKIGLEVPAESWVRKRTPFVVIWVVPAAVFDDADWPGANPAARQQRAADWLAGQGIGLVAR